MERAIRNAEYLPSSSRRSVDLGVDPFETLSVVDYGDVEVTPGYPEITHQAIRRAVSDVMTAGAIPIVLGGDHSIAHPDVGAVADHLKPEPLGLIHFDAHADNAYEEHVFLSVEVDVCDPAYAPGTGTPEPGGLQARELLGAVRRIAAGGWVSIRRPNEVTSGSA